MHVFTMVLVPADTQDIMAAVDALLEPYDQYREVEPHKAYVGSEYLQIAAKTYGTSLTDLPALAVYMSGARGTQYEVDERGIFTITTYNDQGYWDYWRIGGNWNGVIQGKRRDMTVPGKDGLVHEPLQYNICSVAELAPDIFAWHLITPDGQWHEGDWGRASAEDQEQWRATLWELLEHHRDCFAVGVDCHL